tara:strand:+ start:100 stop:633 length:534 start_codon:yes stop_codon:yes gene_type:complete
MTEPPQHPKILKIGEVDLNKLRLDALDISKQRQYPLQGLSKDDFQSSVTDNIDLRNNEEDYTVRLYNNMEYSYSIIEKFNLHRSKYMFLPSITCYGVHSDNTARIHIPIETNQNCFFILDDEVVRLPADGSVYWVNTTLPHTFVNANPHKTEFVRIHLVGSTRLNIQEARFLADHLL